MEVKGRQKCIFCAGSLDNSREHVIPNCLNGRQTSKELLCSDCNSLFDKHLDDGIKLRMNPILFMIGFKNAQQFFVYTHDKKRYLMKRNMTMEPVLPELNMVKKKGKRTFRVPGKEPDVKNVLKNE